MYFFLYMLEKMNLSTKTSLVLDEEIFLGACIEGFETMRKVFIVDATFLRTVHGGLLILVTTRNLNRHHYLIAFGFT